MSAPQVLLSGTRQGCGSRIKCSPYSPFLTEVLWVEHTQSHTVISVCASFLHPIKYVWMQSIPYATPAQYGQEGTTGSTDRDGFLPILTPCCSHLGVIAAAVAATSLVSDKALENVERGPNYYQLLGLRRGSSAIEIKRAYRQLSLELHPDKNPSKDAAEKFGKMSAALEVSFCRGW